MLESGAKVGRYVIRSLIGAGGMGKVYLAQDSELERLVALKILPANMAKNADLMQRFIREAKAASALNHPNILTIYEIGESEGLRFMASELVKGETLSKIISRKNLSLIQILDVSLQVVQALQAAHEAGIIHRDIKPDNLMVREDNLVKVLDFGLAKLIEQPVEISDGAVKNNPITLQGMIMGTPQYMSPEQTEGGEIDARTDLWSFGAVLYELIAGEKAFKGETIAETIVSILINEPKTLSEIKQEIPAELEEIVNRLLRKNSDERYASARDLAIAIKDLKRRLELEADLNNLPSDAQNITKPEAQTEDLYKTTVHKDLNVPSNNLSESIFTIVGREKEIGEICNLLKNENVRLLTMIGVGGTGKTRLSQAVARQMFADFPDGVFFIELAAITNPDLVASTIAQPLGIKEAGGKPILENLKEFLHERRLLLVLDNFEQITSAAPIVADILAAAPNLKILVTSRILLRLSAEYEYSVPPLDLPTDDAPGEELLKYEAVKLFVERARMVKPNFALNDEILKNIAEICVRLDGLPLAIELAAARVKILPPQSISAKLENRLQLLTGGAQDLPARQQTIRGAVEWSYDLLEEDDKKLFRFLSVFAGGFTFDAAEAVVGDLAENINVLDRITSLLDKSLLVQKELPDGETRFRMLEVVREYAAEQLEKSGEDETLRQKYAEYFLNLAEEAEPFLHGENAPEWVRRLEAEHDNIRAVLQWSLKNDLETAMRTAGAIRLFWGISGHLSEGRKWVGACLEQTGNASASAREKVYFSAGVLSMPQGDYDASEFFYKKSLELAEITGNKKQIALANRNLGVLASLQDKSSDAQAFFEKSLEIGKEINDAAIIALAYAALGEFHRTGNNNEKAYSLFVEALELFRKLGRKDATAMTLLNLGAIAFSKGDYRKSRNFYAEALKVSRELGFHIGIFGAFDGFAALSVERKDFKRAARLAGAVEALSTSIGYELEAADKIFRENYVSALRYTMDEEKLLAYFEQGRKMKLDEILKLII